LLDTTVWSKSRSRPELVKWFNEAIAADLVLVCDIVELEVLRSARDHRSFLTQAEQLDLLAAAQSVEQRWHGRRRCRGCSPRQGSIEVFRQQTSSSR
jgi:predicted nucleic acid-binding protein